VFVEVEDRYDPRLVEYFGLKDVALRRRAEPEQGLFMAESAHVITRALDAGITPRSLLLAAPTLPTMAPLTSRLDPGVPVYVGTYELLREITGFHVHRGVLAAMNRPEPRTVEQVLAAVGSTPADRPAIRRVAVLEDIVDHTNVGAIIRAAAGLGVGGVLVTPRCADPLYRRAVRVAMGTVFQIPWARIAPWPAGMDMLRQAGYTVAAMALDADAIDLDNYVAGGLPPKLAILLGTEGAGLSARSVGQADAIVRIPMLAGVDSLNVAAAAAVAFWATRPAGD
jgi:tRNA G18 (ribose-2'-O)-methylase SpoU